MTVRELIAKLGEFDPDYLVCICDQEITPASSEIQTAEIDVGEWAVVINASTF
jgi:hypothetical protein